ncbi:hypothetical protein DID78_04050 [Candidatus Marinamargulisbacteria bacterium SCGC AG-343-D04]|nr:hypothetical protein DID78_04050 [Candidatus Marinamargulisbacteria bacterium SCGC AG-343-D04]
MALNKNFSIFWNLNKESWKLRTQTKSEFSTTIFFIQLSILIPMVAFTPLAINFLNFKYNFINEPNLFYNIFLYILTFVVVTVLPCGLISITNIFYKEKQLNLKHLFKSFESFNYLFKTLSLYFKINQRCFLLTFLLTVSWIIFISISGVTITKIIGGVFIISLLILYYYSKYWLSPIIFIENKDLPAFEILKESTKLMKDFQTPLLVTSIPLFILYMLNFFIAFAFLFVFLLSHQQALFPSLPANFYLISEQFIFNGTTITLLLFYNYFFIKTIFHYSLVKVKLYHKLKEEQGSKVS